MKKFFLTVLMSLGFFCSVLAQEVTFNIVKTDGTLASHVMSSDAKIYYSETQLFIATDGTTVSYDLSSLRKAYFTVYDNVEDTDNQQLTIYPNPANDILKIMNISDNQLVTIYSLDGRVAKRTIVSAEAEIDISDMRPGLYVISAGNLFSKFIKM